LEELRSIDIGIPAEHEVIFVAEVHAYKALNKGRAVIQIVADDAVGGSGRALREASVME
jgi:hypothetical protein